MGNARRSTSRRARKVWRTARATVRTSDRSTRPSHRSTDCCASLLTLSLLRFAVPNLTNDATSFSFAHPTCLIPSPLAWPGSTRATRTAACRMSERRNGRVSSASSSWRRGVRGSPAPTTTRLVRTASRPATSRRTPLDRATTSPSSRSRERGTVSPNTLLSCLSSSWDSPFGL